MPNLKTLSPGNVPEEVNVVIEIPQGSRIKYELDEETGVIKVDRILKHPVGYPANYGFIPSTLFDDGDPLDVVLVSNHVLAPGIVVKARPIGVMKMIDSGEQDDKIICVMIDDPEFANVSSLSGISPEKQKNIELFFSTYKIPEGKETSVDGWEDQTVAFEIIKKSVAKFEA